MTMRLAPISAAVAMACLAVPTLGFSQPATGDAAAGDAGATAAAPSQGLQEVVVTAAKVTQDVQKTPISMEVYTPQEIALKGITDFTTLAQNDPSLNFTGGEEGWLTLRGISSTDTTEIGSPSIPVYVDGFTSNRSWDLNADMFDVGNIDILRGPQGTLYGRSSTGGAIVIATNQPTKSFEAMGQLQYGNYSTLNTTGVVNIPVSDAFQMRVAFNTLRNDGYYGTVVDYLGNDPSSAHGDDTDDRAMRASIAFEPFDHFHGTLIYEETHIGGVGEVGESLPANYIQTNGVPCPSYIYCSTGANAGLYKTLDISHLKPPLTPNTFPIYGQPWQDIYTKIGKWNLVYDGLPGGTSLTFLGGYGIEAFHHLGQGGYGSFLYPGDYGAPTYPNDGAFPPVQYDQNEVPHTVNAEFRVTSPQTGFFTWQAGVYFFEENNNLDSYTVLNGDGPANAGAGELASQKLIEFIFPSVYQSDKAAYGQGNFQLSENGKLELGVRYNADEVLRSGNSLFNLYYIHALGIPEKGQEDSVRATWHAGYDYQMTPSKLLYAKVDSGYKPGGFDTCGSYMPTSVTTGEIGSKARYNDGRLQWNIDGFYNDYRDMQVAQFTATCISGTHTTNAGKSRIWGFENDLTALLGAGNRFDLNLSYLNARFLDFQVPPNIGAPGLGDCSVHVVTSAGTNCQLAGNTLPSSPAWTIVPTLEHDFMLPKDSVLSLRVDAKYVSQTYYDSFNYPDTTQPAYTIGNAYLDYTRGNWLFGLYAKNFTNKYYLTNASEGSGGGTGLATYTYYWGDPRTIGAMVQLTLH